MTRPCRSVAGATPHLGYLYPLAVRTSKPVSYLYAHFSPERRPLRFRRAPLPAQDHPAEWLLVEGSPVVDQPGEIVAGRFDVRIHAPALTFVEASGTVVFLHDAESSRFVAL